MVHQLSDRQDAMCGNRWQTLRLVICHLRSPTGIPAWACFFVIFVNNMLCLTQVSLALFADDAKTQCFHTLRSVSDCESLQSDIDNQVE